MVRCGVGSCGLQKTFVPWNEMHAGLFLGPARVHYYNC
jgi:hypothetical protein